MVLTLCSSCRCFESVILLVFRKTCCCTCFRSFIRRICCSLRRRARACRSSRATTDSGGPCSKTSPNTLRENKKGNQRLFDVLLYRSTSVHWLKGEAVLDGSAKDQVRKRTAGKLHLVLPYTTTIVAVKVKKNNEERRISHRAFRLCSWWWWATGRRAKHLCSSATRPITFLKFVVLLLVVFVCFVLNARLVARTTSRRCSTTTRRT
jgi:hypothetical protein